MAKSNSNDKSKKNKKNEEVVASIKMEDEPNLLRGDLEADEANNSKADKIASSKKTKETKKSIKKKAKKMKDNNFDLSLFLTPSTSLMNLSFEELTNVAFQCLGFFELFLELKEIPKSAKEQINKWEKELKSKKLTQSRLTGIGKEMAYLIFENKVSKNLEKLNKAKTTNEVFNIVEIEIVEWLSDVADSPDLKEKFSSILDIPSEPEETLKPHIQFLENFKAQQEEGQAFHTNVLKRLNENPYPENIKKAIQEELKTYSALSSSNDTTKKEYINYLLDIPYWQTQAEESDLTKIISSLDFTHYGMEKVKERIIEYLAVRVNADKTREPVICLVGPPGVGKTSLVYSIANALNKKFVKISLAGVRDEAEIRGHRRTYVGSMPGRIIKAIKQSGVINPLILLDEIDKIGSDHKGDPAAALLEVLDPSQNKEFTDNYLQETYDLSNVLFIATANYLDQIPEALRDRIEIIDLNSYTIDEKCHIATTHLIPNILKEYKIDPKELIWSDDMVKYLINHYTYEAGVRELDRLIRKVYRKYLVMKITNKTLPKEITVELITELLGKIIFDYTKKDKNSITGVVNGMAYTSGGGDLLPIECNTFKGKGEIKITGNLKETMKESVLVALDYVKANAEKFGVSKFDFKNNDIHIHVPDGGIPKDGPSAGVTLTTALISKLSERKVPTNVSMTGEITLRGKVGRIGGVREKVISAHRGGVRKIFLPIENERDLDDVPQDIRNEIEFHFAETYDSIYNNLFGPIIKN